MDLPHHGRYEHSNIFARPDYIWPDGKRLAFYVCVAVEHFAFAAGVGEDQAVPNSPQTDRNYAWRDYGQRVGLWRLLDMLDGLGIPVALAVNSLIFPLQPCLAARLCRRNDEVVAHGRTSSESHASMWPDDEAAAVRDVTTTIAEQFGRAPLGWASPALAESAETLDILAQNNYRYVLDWPADDQPFWIGTRSGALLSVPFPLEMNDTTVLLHRHHSGREFADMIVNQFDEMLSLSQQRALVLPLMLHPYIVGQPFRLRALRKALAHCRDARFADQVWFTRPGDIARYCMGLSPGIIP